MPRAALVIGLLVLSSAGQVLAQPATRWVNDNDPNGGGYAPPGTSCEDPGYSTISAAVVAASPGDTINVCPGTYTENVTINKSTLTIKSTGGASVTTVNAAGSIATMSFSSRSLT